MTRHVEACLCRRDDGSARERNDSNLQEEQKGSDEPEIERICDAADEAVEGDGTPSSFCTVIVGRRYASGASEALKRGMGVRISPEPNNPHDRNALLCTTASGTAIGHLPAVVAAKLGPLVRTRAVEVQGHILRDAAKLENVMVSVTVSMCVDSGGVVDLNALDSLVHSLHRIAKEHRESLSQASRNYLDRLKYILRTVEVIEQRALGDTEEDFLNAFKTLSPTAQLLFARLAMRNKTYFASKKVHINDVFHVQATVGELISAGVCQPLDVLDLKTSPAAMAVTVINDIFSNKAELVDMLVDVGKPPKNTAKRVDLVASLAKSVRSQSQLKWSFVVGPSKAGPNTAHAPAKRVADTCGIIFCIHSQYLLAFHRIVRLFFLNEGLSVHHFHAVDAGTLRYPSFPITREREVFKDRSQYIEYEDALNDAHNLIASIERAGKADLGKSNEAIDDALSPVWLFLDSQQNKIPPDETTPPFLARYDARWLYSVMATVGIGILERRKAYSTAIERIQQLMGGCYCPERRGYWWIRLSVNLEHIGRPTDSLELAETALADPSLAAHEQLTLKKRVLKLSKPPRRWKKPAWKDDMPSEPRSITIEAKALGGNGARVRYESGDSVEEVALKYYASERGGNYEGIHSESSVFTLIFTLILWPALFTVAVPDAFRTSLQTAPLDLGHPGFYECRSSKIEEILDAVHEGHAPRLIESTWIAHHGTMACGIGDAWNSWNLEKLQTIVKCIGGRGLAAICRILCLDYANMTAGMPDLLLWNAERGVAKLSEVKSTNDVLSDKQRIWINELEKAGVDVEVCLVREPNGKRPRR